MRDGEDRWSEGFFDEWYLRAFGFPGPAQSDAEAEALRQLLPDPPARVLDVPCGPGRHSVRLAAAGYEVTGVDSSALFLDLARGEARRVGVSVDFVESDMRALLHEDQFDVVLCLSTSIGYFDEATNQDVVGRMTRALRPGGRLTMQTMNRDWLVANYQPRLWQDVDEYGVVWQERSFDSVTGVNRGSHIWRLPSGEITRRDHSLRVYTATELGPMLEFAGLTSMEWYGDLAGQPLTHESRWIVVIAHRTGHP